MKYNINDLKIIVNDKILDDIRKYYCLNTNYEMADRTIRIEDGKVVSGGVRYAR